MSSASAFLKPTKPIFRTLALDPLLVRATASDSVRLLPASAVILDVVGRLLSHIPPKPGLDLVQRKIDSGRQAAGGVEPLVGAHIAPRSQPLNLGKRLLQPVD